MGAPNIKQFGESAVGPLGLRVRGHCGKPMAGNYQTPSFLPGRLICIKLITRMVTWIKLCLIMCTRAQSINRGLAT